MFQIAQERDLPRISAIYEKIHDGEEMGKSSIGWIRGVYPTHQTAAEAQKRRELFCEWSDEGRLIGSAIFNHIQHDCYRFGAWEHPCKETEVLVMHTLAIDPDWTGMGYGKAFVRFYEQYALKLQCTELRIDTQEKNLRARRLYRSLGFREVGIVPCTFNGIPDVQLVLLEKRIGGQ